jgi:hypothetical protein
MSRVGLEPTTPMLERAKAVQALGLATTAISNSSQTTLIFTLAAVRNTYLTIGLNDRGIFYARTLVERSTIMDSSSFLQLGNGQLTSSHQL